MAKKIKRFFWLPKCTTCQKAEAFIKDHGAAIDTYVDVKTQTVDRDTLQELADKLGGVENLFSKRAMKYRAWGLHEKQLSEQDMFDYMQQEYTFIKRPVMVTEDGKVLAGFSKKQYEAVLK